VGVRTILLGSKMHQHPITAAVVSQKTQRRLNNTIKSHIRSVGEDALINPIVQRNLSGYDTDTDP
jgi:hypothetical protein